MSINSYKSDERSARDDSSKTSDDKNSDKKIDSKKDLKDELNLFNKNEDEYLSDSSKSIICNETIGDDNEESDTETKEFKYFGQQFTDDESKRRDSPHFQRGQVIFRDSITPVNQNSENSILPRFTKINTGDNVCTIDEDKPKNKSSSKRDVMIYNTKF